MQRCLLKTFRNLNSIYEKSISTKFQWYFHINKRIRVNLRRLFSREVWILPRNFIFESHDLVVSKKSVLTNNLLTPISGLMSVEKCIRFDFFFRIDHSEGHLKQHETIHLILNASSKWKMKDRNLKNIEPKFVHVFHYQTFASSP